MKKIRFKVEYIIFFLLVFLVLGVLWNIYDSFIYYLIPYNPLEAIETNSVLKGKFELFSHSDGLHFRGIEDPDELNPIFGYFKGLNIKPITLKTHNKIISKSKCDVMYSFIFWYISPKDNHKYHIRIGEIYIDELTALYIRSSEPRFKTGYYKIIGSKFDYMYFKKLLKVDILISDKD